MQASTPRDSVYQNLGLGICILTTQGMPLQVVLKPHFETSSCSASRFPFQPDPTEMGPRLQKGRGSAVPAFCSVVTVTAAVSRACSVLAGPVRGNSLVLRTALQGGHHQSPRFIDEETEALRD